MNWLQKVAKNGVVYEFSSVQFNLPSDLANSVKQWGLDNIRGSDLYTAEEKYGREDEMHITVKYGLHTTSLKRVKKVLEGFGSFKISLGKISRFVPKDKEYDVVKIEIDGEGLHELHKKLGDALENSDEHPVYRPHCTLAYVKKGRCSQLSGENGLAGKTALVKELVFSSKNGDKSIIKL